MSEPLTLQHIAKLVCVQNLLNLTEGSDVTDYLKSAYHSAVTEDLLNHLVQFYPKKVSNEILVGLVSPHIRNLKLVNCSRIKPSNFIKIFPYCKNLRGLDLRSCSQLMLPDFFVLINMAGFSLTSVSVEDCTTVDDAVVQSILRNLQHLRHLNVSSCKNITDNAFLLNLDQPINRMDNRSGLAHCGYECSLTSIDVSGCHGLTNMAVRNLVTLTGPTLQHVSMSWTNLTLESLLCLSGFHVPRRFLGCEMENDDELCEMDNDNDVCGQTSQHEDDERILAVSAEEEDAVKQTSPIISQSPEASAGPNNRQDSTTADTLDENCLERDLSQCVKSVEEIGDYEECTVTDLVSVCDKQVNERDVKQGHRVHDSQGGVADLVDSMSVLENPDVCIQQDFAFISQTKDLTDSGENVRLVNNVRTESSVRSPALIQCDVSHDLKDSDSVFSTSLGESTSYHGHIDCLSKASTEMCFVDTTQTDSDEDFPSVVDHHIDDVDSSAEKHVSDSKGILKNKDAFNGDPFSDKGGNSYIDNNESLDNHAPLVSSCAKCNDKVVPCSVEISTNTANPRENIEFLNSTENQDGSITSMSNHTSSKTPSSSTSENATILTTDSDSAGAQESFKSFSKSNTSESSSDVKLNCCTGITNTDDLVAAGSCSAYPVPPIKEPFTRSLEQPSRTHLKSFTSHQGQNEPMKCPSENDLIHRLSNENMFLKNNEGFVDLPCEVSQITLHDKISDEKENSDCIGGGHLSPADILPKVENLATSSNSILPNDAINKPFESLAGVMVPVCSCNVSCESGNQKSEDRGAEGSTAIEADDQSCTSVSDNQQNTSATDDKQRTSANSDNFDSTQPHQDQSNKTSSSAILSKILKLTDLKNNTKSTQGKRQSVNQILSALKHIYKPNIKSIDLEEIHHPNNKQKDLENALSVFITQNPGLQSLKLSWVKFPNHLLKLVVDTCADLREITLIGCNVVDAEHVRYVGAQCKNLRKAELEDLRRMTDWSVVPIVSNPDIENLSLSESDIHDVTAIRMAAKLSENLKSLNISYCQELTERGINAFLRKQSCMESFSARQGALTNLSLGLLSSNFRRLRSLNIASVEAISGSGLVSMTKSLHHLEFIDLSWAGGSSLHDEVTEAILKYCPRINRMVLDGQALLTSKPFLQIISDCEKWNRCKALFVFKVKERAAKAVMRCEDEAESSDDEYEELYFPHRSTHFATNLQHLCLEYCDSITDTDMEDIVTVCRGSITVIDYYSCEVQPKLLTLGRYKVKDLSCVDVPR